MFKKVFLLPLLLISLPAFTTEQLSFSVARDGLTSAVVENVLLKVLVNRRWNITANNHQQIDVSLHKHGTEANLQLRFNDKNVTVISNSYCAGKAEWPDFVRKKEPCFPKNWVNNIKRDTQKFIQQEDLTNIAPETNIVPETTIAPESTVKQRLIALRLLHKEGLITSEQYEEKQKALLGEL